MTTEHEEIRPRVSVSFKRSSTKDAGEGFDLTVEEGATEREAARVMRLAKTLREQALQAINGDTTESLDQWEASIAANGQRA